MLKFFYTFCHKLHSVVMLIKHQERSDVSNFLANATEGSIRTIVCIITDGKVAYLIKDLTFIEFKNSLHSVYSFFIACLESIGPTK
jgi:hypothetical protein